MIANDEIREVKYKTTFGGWIKKTYRGKTLISEEPILPPVKETYSNYSSKNKYSNSDIKINENSQQAVFKNISSQSYQSYSSTNISSGGGGGVGATSAYISDLKDEKNENQKAVELLFNDGLNKDILKATNREEKEELIELFGDCVDSVRQENSKTATKHSVFSLPPNLNVPKFEQKRELEKAITETISEMAEFENKAYLIAVHQDQKDANSGVHCHIQMAYCGWDGSNLHCKSKQELKARDLKFKVKVTEKLQEKGFDIEMPKSKAKLTDDRKRGLLIVAKDIKNNILVMDYQGNLHEIKSKDLLKQIEKAKLVEGDKFDYIVQETKKPKLNKNGKQQYIKGKPQFLKERKIGNIIRKRDIDKKREIEAEIEALGKTLASKQTISIEPQVEKPTEQQPQKPIPTPQQPKQEQKTKPQIRIMPLTEWSYEKRMMEFDTEKELLEFFEKEKFKVSDNGLNIDDKNNRLIQIRFFSQSSNWYEEDRKKEKEIVNQYTKILEKQQIAERQTEHIQAPQKEQSLEPYEELVHKKYSIYSFAKREEIFFESEEKMFMYVKNNNFYLDAIKFRSIDTQTEEDYVTYDQDMRKKYDEFSMPKKQPSKNISAPKKEKKDTGREM